MPHINSVDLSCGLTAREVRPLNHSFEVSPQDALALWLGGKAVSGNKPNRFYESRVRRSEDGNWLIRRRGTHKNAVRPLEDTAAHAMQELENLQGVGVNVISRAMVLSATKDAMFTLSPWIADMRLCRLSTYAADIVPKLEDYTSQVKPGNPMLNDLYRPPQYSYTPEIPETFLHDVDPSLKRS